MELKGRLKLIADKTPACNTICDIGTDHAYIPIYLVKKGICRKGIAADVKSGPITAARENIRAYGLDDFIETRLGDGLEPVKSGEADVIIIAGMGGTLIKDILERGMQKAKSAKTLVLQPMNSVEVLRKWLYDNGFDIFDESLAIEGEKIYNVINAVWDGISRTYKDICLHIGTKLIEKPDENLGVLVHRKLGQVNSILEEIKNAEQPDDTIIAYYTRMKGELIDIIKKI